MTIMYYSTYKYFLIFKYLSGLLRVSLVAHMAKNLNTDGHKISYLLSISAKTHLSNKIYICQLLEFVLYINKYNVLP